MNNMEPRGNMFGRAIREARKREGFTQAKLGKVSGLSKTAIGRYEQGFTRPMDISRIMGLAAALRLDPTALWKTAGQTRRAPGDGAREREAKHAAMGDEAHLALLRASGQPRGFGALLLSGQNQQ